MFCEMKPVAGPRADRPMALGQERGCAIQSARNAALVGAVAYINDVLRPAGAGGDSRTLLVYCCGASPISRHIGSRRRSDFHAALGATKCFWFCVERRNYMGGIFQALEALTSIVTSSRFRSGFKFNLVRVTYCGLHHHRQGQRPV